jgi:hypothetical protein
MEEDNARTEELRNPHVRHEKQDVNPVSLVKFGVAMIVLGMVILLGLWGLFNYFAAREERLGPRPSAWAGSHAPRPPPEPRLQLAPQIDLKEMRAAEDQILNNYAWVDPDKHIVRIPIERAMDLIVQKGLPARTQPQGKKK